jgi:hypothetical protein
MRREVRYLRQIHDSICDLLIKSNRIAQSFDSDLLPKERRELLKNLRSVERSLAKLKQSIPNQLKDN